MNTIKNPITGRDKLVIQDDGVYDAITGAKVGVIENGVVKSVYTGASLAVIVQGEGGDSIDLSFITATSADILSGKVGADTSGNPVYGNISEASAPTVSGNEVTVYKGYQATQKKVTVGVAKSADTITPGTTDVIIPAGTYLLGMQLIKGDANLLAENIKAGVTIFGITGTYEGSGGGGGGSGDSGITTYNYSELDANGDAYVDSDQLSKLFVPVGEKVRIKVRFAASDKDTISIDIRTLGCQFSTANTIEELEDNVRLLTEDGTVKHTSYQDMPGEYVIKDSALPNGNYYIEIDNTDHTQQVSMTGFNFHAYGDATGISDWVESGGSNSDKTPVYRVTHANNGDEVGDYWDSGLVSTWGRPIYTNGVCYLGYEDTGSRSYIRTTAEFNGSYGPSDYLWSSKNSARLPEGVHTGDYEPGSARSFPYANVTKL